jgi:hypothetical protein
MSTRDMADEVTPATVMDDDGNAAYESDLTEEEQKAIAKKKSTEEWQERYNQQKKEQAERIKGIKETAIFKVKGDLYTKMSPQEPFNRDKESDEEFDARQDAMIEKMLADAMTRYVTECMKLLTARKNVNPDDWRECICDLSSIKYIVKGVVRSAHGMDYWG